MEQDDNKPSPGFNDTEIEKTKWKEEFYRETLHALKTEDRFVNFFKSYHPASVEAFMRNYAQQKVYWHLYGESNRQYKRTIQQRWIDEGRECMQMILQKKLFDLQCQFRGNKIKIPGVEVCYQFEEMGENIYDCLFLEPVNETDLTLFTKYLDDCPVEIRYNSQFHWQSHPFIIMGFLEPEGQFGHEYLHSWYDYHNRYSGNDIYLALPDLRGEKEDFYRDLAWAEMREKDKAATAERASSTPPLASLKADEESLLLFAKTFDTPETYHRLKARYDWHAPFEEAKTKAIEDDLKTLEVAKRLVAIDNADDWRDGVKWAAERYKRQMVKEALPQVHEQYMASFLAKKEEAAASGSLVPPMDRVSLVYKADILRGRELNGEQPNLDF
jgi:hypothetical protein